MELRKVLDAQAVLRKTPTSAPHGTFEAIVATWTIDKDHERFSKGAFDEQDGARVALSYQHALAGDPNGTIGFAIIHPTDDGLLARGQLNLKDKMATAIYERMLLPPTDDRALREFSVGFSYSREDVTTGPDGERVFLKAKVIEVSVVHRGAQVGTELLSIKSAGTKLLDPPWTIEERAGKFCVLVVETGAVVKCHPTTEAAMAHLRALFAALDEEERAAEETADVPISKVAVPIPKVDWDAVVASSAWKEIQAEVTRDREREAREKAAIAASHSRSLALMQTRPTRVLTNSRFGVVYEEGATEREVDLQRREAVERAARGAEAAALPPEPTGPFADVYYRKGVW